MMNYYRLKHTLNKKVLGVVEQIKEVQYNGNVDDPNFIDRFDYKKTPKNVAIPNAILYSKAKLTDLISQWGMGFSSKLLLSSASKNLIEKYKNTGLEFLQSSVFKGNTEYKNYWIFKPLAIDIACLDFNKSEIVISNTGEKVYVETIEEFEKKNLVYMDDGRIRYQLKIIKPVFKENCREHFIILRFVYGGVGYYVSEILKKEMEASDLTGMDFIPYQYDKFEEHKYRKTLYKI